MRFLRLLKSGGSTSQAQAGRVIGIGLRGAEKLWNKYRTGGLKGLPDYPFKGSKEKPGNDTRQALIRELSKDSMQSLKQVCDYVEQQSGVHYTQPGMHYVLKRLRIKKKTGRPVHYQKDSAQ